MIVKYETVVIFTKKGHPFVVDALRALGTISERTELAQIQVIHSAQTNICKVASITCETELDRLEDNTKI